MLPPMDAYSTELTFHVIVSLRLFDPFSLKSDLMHEQK